MSKQRIYFCIDMKTFYASVECAERGLNPFETNLVVADVTRGPNALCLAISPKMKAQGIKNRCRLNDIPKSIKYEIAPPRMQLYIEYAADIYSIYLDYMDPQDIHVYSIDESFIDATEYLGLYKMSAEEYAQMLMNEIARRKRIPATAGIGTNLYLAKIALDITAKKVKSHIGYLDERLYDLFTNMEEVEREKKRESAVLGIKTKYGKNAILKGVNYMPESTQRERNTFIGGHRAGDDTK